MSSNKTRLLLPEYGRNVQKMVKFLKTIKDRDLRNRQAEVVVGLMGNIYSGKKDSEDFQHMLWDHLFMIAEFDLDVDSPYPRPDPNLLFPKPGHLSYTQSHDGKKNWGRYFPRMLKAVAEEAKNKDISESDKELLALSFANYAKQQSKELKQDITMSSAIAEEIDILTNGLLHVDAESIVECKNDKRRNISNRDKTKKGKQQSTSQKPAYKKGFSK